MNEKFRVVLAIPSGYAHAKCFTEAALLLKNSLQDLGRECDIAINDFSSDRTNVVLGYHLLAAGDNLRRFRYIPYQLEQLGASESVFSDNVKNIFQAPRQCGTIHGKISHFSHVTGLRHSTFRLDITARLR